MSKHFNVLLSACAVALCVVGCQKPPQPPVIYGMPRRILEDLLPEAVAQPAALTPNAPIMGEPSKPSPEDILAVRKLIGRIPKIDHEIWAMWYWHDMAARVQLHHYLIYCAKDKDGVWQFSSIYMLAI